MHTTHEQNSQREERRGFLKMLSVSSLAVYGASSVYALWRFLVSPSERRIITPPMTIDAAKLQHISERGYTILKFGDKNVLLRKESSTHDSSSYRAFNLRCTHAGCTVEWREGEKKFVCPCHGAEFAANGVATRLPATEPLEELRIVFLKGVVHLAEPIP